MNQKEGYNCIETIEIPASHAKAIRVASDNLLEVIDLEGNQVGDLMAWVIDQDEYFSPAHTLTHNWSAALKKGYMLVTNKRRPIFEILHDDVGKHDIMVPCCDKEAYAIRYDLHDHRSCLSNIEEALNEKGYSCEPRGELAWNIFMANRIEPDGKIVYEEPEHKAGSSILLKCLLPATVALSACPQDQTPTNGWNCSPMQMKVWKKMKDEAT